MSKSTIERILTLQKIYIASIFLIGLFLTACQQGDPNTNIDEKEQTTQQEQQADQSVPKKETAKTEEQDNASDGSNDNESAKADDSTNEEDKQKEIDKHIAKVEKSTGLHVVDNPESPEVYVNKQRTLPEGYVPPNLVVPDVSHYSSEGSPKRQLQKVAADALEQLFAEADQQGIGLVAVSGYRSYERQKQIYESAVANKGQEHADKFSARPGTSEHQTGLAMDVASATETAATLLEQSFKQTDAGAWLAENAHNFGFIIRYPEGKNEITGYNYEPWHIRYVGKEIATEIYNKDITLEEYFGYDY